MNYIDSYDSPVGPITLAGNGTHITGLWFDGQKYDRSSLKTDLYEVKSLPVFDLTKKWLDIYFSGSPPSFTPPLLLSGSAFRQCIAQIMLEIPFGHTTSYGQIAKIAATRTQKLQISAQAVSGAVSHNPISIIIPCHRVIGSSGNLTGYAAGLDIKRFLLNHEHIALR